MRKLDSSDSSTVLTSNVQQPQRQQRRHRHRQEQQQQPQHNQGHRAGRQETTTNVLNSRNKRRRRNTTNNDYHNLLSSLSVGKSISKYWNIYRKFVSTHLMSLELIDEGVCRLLFWMPHHNQETTSWREILFGLLSINRLLMDCSLHSKLINSYGTSHEIDQPNIQATSIRIALSVVHCLMPSILGMISSSRIENETENSMSSSIIQQSQQRQQTYVRFCLEQIKFILRLFLLGSYWKQYSEDDEQKDDNGDSSVSSSFLSKSSSKSTKRCNTSIPIGIMLDGGMFYDNNQPQGLPEIERHTLERRYQYVGRRTGMKLLLPNVDETSTTTKQTIIGELLYILRPLYWAYNEYKHYHSSLDEQLQDYCDNHYDDNDNNEQRQRPSLSLLKGWLTTLIMDIISLRLLSLSQQNQNQDNNRQQYRQHHQRYSSSSSSSSSTTTKELKRRKMKLFFYLLRPPFWSHITSPIILSTTSKLLRKYIPLVGGLIDTCLWDWILYHKQAYVSEEG